MERRKAVTVAATAALTLLAGAGGIALSSGILAASHGDGVGTIRPAGSGTPTVTTYVDAPTPAVTPSSPPGGARVHDGDHDRGQDHGHDLGAHDDD
jgi:hypothetical protein